jgi:hypothetical protein
MKSFIATALAVVAICQISFFSGCNIITPTDPFYGRGTDSTLKALTTMSFTYTGFDRSGNEIVRGILEIYYRDSTTVGGSWKFTATGSAPDIGPQVGKGTLEGTALGDTLFLNLNPGFADNNVFLSGVLHGGSFSGTWTWVGFAGVINQGTFRSTMPLLGSWIWLKSTGGLAYHEMFPPPAQTIVFGANGSFMFYRGDSLEASTTYIIKREVTIFGQDTVDVIHYAGSLRFVAQMYSFKADTLFLTDLCFDCFGHAYIKIDPEGVR